MALQFTHNGDRFGIDLEIEYGLPGASGAFDHVAISTTQKSRTRRVRHTSLDAAASKYHQTIQAKLEEGFVLEVDGVSISEPEPATFTPLPELELLVEVDAQNTEHWLALSAAWQAAGDPRGDCIEAERSVIGVTDVAEYARRKKLIEASRRIRNAYVWGNLGRDAYRLRATFRNGLVDRFMLQDEVLAPGRPTHELVAVALATPFARFVREIYVPSGQQSSELEDVIAASPCARHVSLV